jgi:hypothetical protein
VTAILVEADPPTYYLLMLDSLARRHVVRQTNLVHVSCGSVKRERKRRCRGGEERKKREMGSYIK